MITLLFQSPSLALSLSGGLRPHQYRSDTIEFAMRHKANTIAFMSLFLKDISLSNFTRMNMNECYCNFMQWFMTFQLNPLENVNASFHWMNKTYPQTNVKKMILRIENVLRNWLVGWCSQISSSWNEYRSVCSFR